VAAFSSSEPIGVFSRWRETLGGLVPVAVVATLVCCALPITLVALGAGSVVAALITVAPWVTVFSRHKEWVVLTAGLGLVVDYWVLFRSTSAACQPGGVCHVSHPFGQWLRRLFWASVAAYIVGIGAAYFLLPIVKVMQR